MRLCLCNRKSFLPKNVILLYCPLLPSSHQNHLRSTPVLRQRRAPWRRSRAQICMERSRALDTLAFRTFALYPEKDPARPEKARSSIRYMQCSPLFSLRSPPSWHTFCKELIPVFVHCCSLLGLIVPSLWSLIQFVYLDIIWMTFWFLPIFCTKEKFNL